MSVTIGLATVAAIVSARESFAQRQGSNSVQSSRASSFKLTYLAGLILALATLALGGATALAAGETKRVLVLHSFGQDFQPWRDYGTTIRSELQRHSPWPLDIIDQSLLTARSSDENSEPAFIDFLRAVFADRAPDLLVTIGGPAASFLQRRRSSFFSDVPAVLAAVEQRNVRPSALTDNDTVVATRNNFRVFFDTILRIAPDTTTIAVVNGSSPLERFWLQELRKEVSGYEGRLNFIWYSTFSFEDILKHAAALPPRSAIFWQLMNVDAAGVSHEGDKALRRLHAVANAPIFSYQEALFGPHMVGGPLHSIADPSQQAAAVGVRLLRGERAGDIAPIAIDFSTYRFNWKELQRWGLSAARLPPGSDVRFRDPSLWEKHGEFIRPLFLVLFAQCVMIAWLLREHRKRRRSESAAHELSGRLIFAQEDERSRLARELHDDVTQRLALLAIEAGNEERNLRKPETTVAARTMREKLVRLSDDVHALSYRLHPSILEDLGLTEALRSECERFSRTFPIRLTADIPDLEPNVPRDAALCIFRIGQEALRNIARHSGATRATVSLRELGDALDLVISDNGSGFDVARSKPGRSLGHTGMRQRAFLLGGKVDISSGPGRGTSIRARIPVVRERHESPARVAG